MTAAFTGAHAQQATSKKATSAKSATTKPAAKANDGWGDEAPAATTTKAAATDATATPAQSQASGFDAGANGGFGGAYGSGADNSPSRVEGMSVAPGSPLLPSTRSRSDYMGRPIERKPSMRPRSQDYSNPRQ
ncbi:hypothetical protein [Hymenobacter busanensis]|nr:hypothetical protein [Hymenobacter busanensis]